MVDTINSWVQSIIFSSIITVIIEMILPDSNNKKYIRTVIGIYIVFVIINPIITGVFNKKIEFDSVFASYEIPDVKETNINTKTYVESTYKSALENDIKSSIGSLGYIVKDVYLEINTSDNNYGEITKIYLEVSKKEEDTNEVEKIEEVDIGITKEAEANSKLSLDKEDVRIIKEFLNKNYEIKEEDIIIGGI